MAAEVRAALARRQVHQSEVARALGLSEMAMSRRATGKMSFSVEELATVATVLGMDVHDLMPSVPVVGLTANNGWYQDKIPQPRGHIGHGLLGSWDHHYPPLRLVRSA